MASNEGPSLFGLFLRGLWFVVSRAVRFGWRVLVVFVALAFAVGLLPVSMVAGQWLIIAGLVVLAGVEALLWQFGPRPGACEFVRRFGIWFPTFLTIQHAYMERKRMKAGQAMLVQTKLVPDFDTAELYDDARLWVDKDEVKAIVPAIPGKSLDDVRHAMDSVSWNLGESPQVAVYPANGHITVVMKSRRVMPEGRLDFRIRAERSLDAIPVGLSDNRCVVTMRIAQSNALIAGLPGSGKSVFENIILANLACLDSLVEIWAIDPKRVEMQPWKPLLYRLATEEDEFLPLLNGLADAMNQRYEYMAEHGLRKLEPDAEHPAIVLLIDELAELTATGDSKRDKAVAAAIRLLVQKGRAAGVSVIAATQRPSSDVVPTSLRDLFVQRCAMSCATVESARMILGDSIPENEGPQTIAASAKGVGYLMADTDREPTMFKSFYISDAQVARFVALAKSGAIRNGLVKSNGGGVQ